MSGLTQPRGPLPARVYWIRRTLVLATALALVVALGMLLTRGSDGSGGGGEQAVQAGSDTGSDAPAEDETEPSPTTSASPEAGATPPAATKGPRKKRKPKRTPPAVPDGECDPSDVSVEPVVNDAVAGDDIAIWLRVSTTGREACTWSLDQESIALKITSGSDDIWSSSQCAEAVPDKELVARAAKPAAVRFTWDARRSDDGCTNQRDWVLDGYYHVEAAPLGGEPIDTQFEVTLPTRPTVTPSPKGDKDSQKGGKDTSPEGGKDKDSDQKSEQAEPAQGGAGKDQKDQKDRKNR